MKVFEGGRVRSLLANIREVGVMGVVRQRFAKPSFEIVTETPKESPREESATAEKVEKVEKRRVRGL